VLGVRRLFIIVSHKFQRESRAAHRGQFPVCQIEADTFVYPHHQDFAF
jgi:hypothetical protein